MAHGMLKSSGSVAKPTEKENEVPKTPPKKNAPLVKDTNNPSTSTAQPKLKEEAVKLYNNEILGVWKE